MDALASHHHVPSAQPTISVLTSNGSTFSAGRSGLRATSTTGASPALFPTDFKACNCVLVPSACRQSGSQMGMYVGLRQTQINIASRHESDFVRIETIDQTKHRGTKRLRLYHRRRARQDNHIRRSTTSWRHASRGRARFAMNLR